MMISGILSSLIVINFLAEFLYIWVFFLLNILYNQFIFICLIIHRLRDQSFEPDPQTKQSSNATKDGSDSARQAISKRSLKSLSAIPKSKLHDNDSWIVKKNTDGKKDYHKHWLIQVL